MAHQPSTQVYPQVYSIHLPLALQTSETRNSLETRTFPGRPPSRAFHWPRPTASMGLRGLPQITNSKVSVCISPKATEKTVVYTQRRHRRCPNSPSGTGSSDCNPFELFTWATGWDGHPPGFNQFWWVKSVHDMGLEVWPTYPYNIPISSWFLKNSIQYPLTRWNSEVIDPVPKPLENMLVSVSGERYPISMVEKKWNHSQGGAPSFIVCWFISLII